MFSTHIIDIFAAILQYTKRCVTKKQSYGLAKLNPKLVHVVVWKNGQQGVLAAHTETSLVRSFSRENKKKPNKIWAKVLTFSAWRHRLADLSKIRFFGGRFRRKRERFRSLWVGHGVCESRSLCVLFRDVLLCS